MATRLKVIVFTDRVGSSAAATDIGDAGRARVNQTQESITREVAAETRGEVIKFLGDGHLLTFDCAGEADEVVFAERVLAVLPPRFARYAVLKTEQLKGDDQPTTLYRLVGLADEGPRAFRNPFIIGGPILNPRDFCGRKRQMNFSMTRLSSMQSISIVGERRIGKTSLLRCLLGLLSDRLGPAYRAACIDLMPPSAHTIPGVLGEIQRQLGLSSPVATLPEFCDRLTKMQEAGARPVIGLDEIEMLIRRGEEFSRDFCEALRSIAQLGHVAVITTSRSTLRELHDQGALVSPLFNIMGGVSLQELPDDEARELVTAPRPGVAFTSPQVDGILERGRGHPLRLQILCWHVAQANFEERTDWPRVWAEAEGEIADLL